MRRAFTFLLLALQVAAGASAQTATSERPPQSDRDEDDGGGRRPLRGAARITLDGGEVALFFGTPPFDGREGRAVAALLPGAPLLFYETMVLKLHSAVALRAGTVTLRPGNVAEGYPGTWGLWVVRTAGGYQLALTEAADVWGTQFDRAEVVAEVPLLHSEAAEPAARFTGELEQRSGGLILRLRFGPHSWEAAFELAAGAGASGADG